MTMVRTAILSISALATVQVATASDLQVQVRAHSRRVAFGDPLYLEVTILNAGRDAISAPTPSPAANTFGFTVLNPEYDVQTGLRGTSGGGGFVGGAGTTTYQPGSPIKHYWYVFLPDMRWYTHPFWKPLQDGQSVDLWGVYGLRRSLSLTSNRIAVFLASRSIVESEALREWAPERPVTALERGPNGASFGLQFLQPLARQDVMQASQVFRTGEIADLLDLTTHMQELYATPDQDRDERNQKLIEWFKTQADIKRQALAIETRNIAGGHNMVSTQRALEHFIASPQFSDPEAR